ncbi:MAG: 2-octaprenyl-6-methoxyphenol hydroxylase [Alphaproteobacteria bacterium MarineAlpha11_Bin1]|nr:MAG: 2-octaprenyl-6-methoxyphenol hydroxylase [Alphaproteobacteria bacterium MarineAlpha11_Bin1]|tara:strand:- start:22900 stop:24111 length:1212 start_codon:yes stop_codon:yes gene_type:complete
MNKERFDVAIIGGGIVGLSLALNLLGVGARVVVIERGSLDDMAAATFDGRGSAVSAGSQLILNGTGLWGPLSASAEPILEIRVADGTSPLFLHYDHRDLGKGPLGWIVENAHIRRTLAQEVKKRGLPVLEKVPLSAAHFYPSYVSLDLDDGRSVEARLAVAADGRHSAVREMAGIDAVSWSYPQTGIVCAVEHEVSHQGVAHEHFLSSGPFAILPMTKNRSSIVWTERNEFAAKIIKLDDATFAEELHSRFGSFLGEVRVGSERWLYPLSAVHARRYVAPRVALIGDSAHAIHPIAGQGLNLGLRDVAALAEIIVDRLRLGLDPGDAATLEHYERWRKPDNMMMIAATDSLNRLFSNDIAPIRLARDAGLGLVNQSPPLKRLLMKHAMGQLGELPRLARGQPL